MYVAIFVGGALGSLLRELTLPLIPGFGPLTSTFFINVVACYFIGLLYGIRHRVHVHVMPMAAIGFCGGLSTFSTFTADVFDLAARDDLFGVIVAPTFEIAFGILAAAVGERSVRRFHGLPSR